MTKTEDLIKRRDAIMPRGIPRARALAVASGHGATLVDVDGREFLDFCSGIGVTLTGHCQPEIVAAISAQAAILQHACIHIATYEPYIALCERLAGIFPHGPSTKVMLVNSGAEAVENAVKIARQATGRAAVICYTESFHGRTLMAMSLTSKAGYKEGCGPFAPEVYRLPYPNHFRYGGGLDLENFVKRELTRFQEALVNLVPASSVAAVILEPVQGEGGFVPCPLAYMQGLRELCDRHGIMLITDEVQSGFCRTGRWASSEHSGITPDLSTWAKALGGGLPLAAVIGKTEVMDAARPGTIGSTYGGNPVACAAAQAGIDIMARDDYCARALRLGARIRAKLHAFQEHCPLVADVRGMGVMIALELAHGRDPRRPAATEAKKAVALCLERGLVVITAGADGNIIRLLPPLSISEEELDRGLDIMLTAILDAVKDS